MNLEFKCVTLKLQPTFGVGEVWALEFLPPTAYLSKVTKT